MHLKLEHLLTMSSGLDCDNGDAKSPGYEDFMLGQHQQPDFYQFMLTVDMIRDPGEEPVDCSGGTHLVGHFLKQLAKPLQIEHCYMPLTPTGDVYMGGGARFLPRDFMKLGRLYLNGGIWNGTRILQRKKGPRLLREWQWRATRDRNSRT